MAPYFTILFVLILIAILYQVKGQVSLNTCTDLDSIKIAIPGTLTAHSRPITFGLKVAELKCETRQKIKLLTTEGQKDERKVTKERGHFLKDGTLLIGNSYYDPKDYCIRTITAEGMNVDLCQHACDKVNIKEICVSKCCDLDKVLDGLGGASCEFSDLQWNPIFYDPVPESSPRRKIFRSGKMVILPEDTPLRVLNSSLTDHKIEIRNLNCDPKNVVTWSLRNLTRFGFQNMQFRFLSNGSLIYFNNSRWSVISTSFCIDGLQNFGMGLFYSGSVWDQVVRMCPMSARTIPTASEDARRATVIWIPITYGLVMFCSCSLLSITILVYFLLRSKQKFHMWVVASYIISLLLLNMLFGISNILSQLGLSTNEMMRGSTACILIGATTHLLILSTFIWLTFLNLNIWVTFRTLISSPSLSIQRHGIKRFLVFSSIAWGIPGCIVIVALILDYLNRLDTSKEIFSPGYGVGRCLISRKSEGVFLFYPIGMLILFNATIFVFTIFRISLYQELTQGLRVGNSKRSKQCKLIRIYTMLLLTATILWLTEFISWHFEWDATIAYWILIDFLNLMQSLLIFIIFVWRKKTLGSLEEKYPTVKRASMYFSMRKTKVEKEILISKSSSQSSR